MSRTRARGERRCLERSPRELREHELEVLLVAPPANLRYLTGFTGTNGLALVVAGRCGRAQPASSPTSATTRSRRRRSRSCMSGDLRDRPRGGARTRAVPECGRGGERGGGEPPGARLAELFPRGGRLGFDEGAYDRSTHACASCWPERWELVAVRRAWSSAARGQGRRRRSRDPRRQRARRRGSTRRAGTRAWSGAPSARWRSSSSSLMRRLGAAGPSFPSIVAAGAHGALPHAEPRAEPIARDALVTIDWGALLDGLLLGLHAHVRDRRGRLRPGARGLRARAPRPARRARGGSRRPQRRRGRRGRARGRSRRPATASSFGHGLGHGVGLEVHEAPAPVAHRRRGAAARRATSSRSSPASTSPAVCGVRIEDLVVVRDGRYEVLTGLPKELTVVA